MEGFIASVVILLISLDVLFVTGQVKRGCPPACGQRIRRLSKRVKALEEAGLNTPEYCTDPDGNRKALGNTWGEGIKHCECIVPESLLWFWDGNNPSDAVSHCLVDGCPVNGSTKKVVKEGETFGHSGFDKCICRKGTNPMLADVSTRYYGECQPGPSYITFDT